jgi:hypothetical protein
VGKYILISRFTRNMLYVYGPQFDTAELHVMSAFENIFDISLVQLIVDETGDDFARYLKSKKTDCVGTLRANRKNCPSLVKNKKLKKGEHFGQHSGDVSAVLAWRDKSDYHINIPQR